METQRNLLEQKGYCIFPSIFKAEELRLVSAKALAQIPVEERERTCS